MKTSYDLLEMLGIGRDRLFALTVATDGFSPQHNRLLAVSCAKVEHAVQPVERLFAGGNPDATAHITGISAERYAVEAVPLADACAVLRTMLPEGGVAFGHNIWQFTLPFLEQACPEIAEHLAATINTQALLPCVTGGGMSALFADCETIGQVEYRLRAAKMGRKIALDAACAAAGVPDQAPPGVLLDSSRKACMLARLVHNLLERPL